MPLGDLTGDYGLRHDPRDGRKGKGYFGPLTNSNGDPMTELSVGDGGREYPSLVPTLTKGELDHLLNGGEMTDEIRFKAKAHAALRGQRGKSVWAQPNEVYPLPGALESVNGAR